MSKQFNLYKLLLVCVVAFSASSLFAEGGSGGFDASAFLASAQNDDWDRAESGDMSWDEYDAKWNHR